MNTIADRIKDFELEINSANGTSLFSSFSGPVNHGRHRSRPSSFARTKATRFTR